MRTALPLAALAITAVVLLSGCVPQEPEILPPPEPTSEPVFASDEEALAAATKAYEAYLAMSDLIAQEGGKDPERIAPYVTEEWLEQEVEAFKDLSMSGRHQIGHIKVLAREFQAHTTDLNGLTTVGAYFCLDFSASSVATSDGIDVTPGSRPPTITVEVHFESTPSAPEPVVGGIEPWPSSGIC